jgi:hypothetical protein
VPVQEELAVPGPVQDVRQSPYSIDNPANQAADHMLFEPYRESDNPPLELNLWGLENRKVFRSIPVLTPDRQWMAYTEAVYFSFTKQVMTALYLVPIPPLPVSAQPAAPGLPAPVTPPLEPRYYYARFNPDNLLPQRIQIHQTGFDKLVPNDFKTFTIVDWSQGRTRLLFRQRNGVLHYGLRTSDILVYDSQRGTVTIYPELKRVLRNYWQAPERLGAAYAKLTPDIEPIGWAAGSDHLVIFRGNALDKSGKKTFLGVWQYDIDAQRSQLLSTSAEAPLPRIASNGLIARPDPAYAEAYDRYQLQKKKYKRFHRPRKQPPVFRPAGASPDDVTKP